MPAPSELLRAVEARILAHELRRREAVGAAVPARLDGPPITVLTARAFPRPLLERRLRFLRTVGWIGGDIGPCIPFESPALPAPAGVADHVAVIAFAPRVGTDAPALASLAAAVGAPVVTPSPGLAVAVDDGSWDAHLDAAADAHDPAWRHRAGRAPDWAGLEAVTVQLDAAFGRRRARSAWPALREAARWSGEVKRRIVG